MERWKPERISTLKNACDARPACIGMISAACASAAQGWRVRHEGALLTLQPAGGGMPRQVRGVSGVPQGCGGPAGI